MTGDISPDFSWNKKDWQTIQKVLPHEATPEAVKAFARYAYRLSDYGYWFLLSTLWVSYTGWSDLDLWKRLFLSTRGNRETSIMKPSELAVFRALGDPLTLYRAHRSEETDWISYTLSPLKAAEFAARRGVDQVKEYRVAKVDALCLFLRRGEFEALVLDKAKAEFVREVTVKKC
jgi:hypothetical protein